MSSDPTSRNHALWLAPLIAVVGFSSYWAFFARWPIFRDHPWLNLLILAAAVLLSVSGLRRAWPEAGFSRVAGVLGVFLSSALMLLLISYSYVLSYELPSAELAAETGERVPAITLTAHDGAELDLGATGKDKLLLVFYRGHW